MASEKRDTTDCEDGDRTDDDDRNHFNLSLPGTPRRNLSKRSIRSARSADIAQTYRFASFKGLLVDFCNRTSSHGVPFLGSVSLFGPWIWGLIFFTCFISFCIQTYWTMSEFFQFRTIIEMQLKFEPAPFPAATVCNLNAFKYSELQHYEEIAQGFSIWERAMNARGLNLDEERFERLLVHNN